MQLLILKNKGYLLFSQFVKNTESHYYKHTTSLSAISSQKNATLPPFSHR